jgi:VirK protein
MLRKKAALAVVLSLSLSAASVATVRAQSNATESEARGQPQSYAQLLDALTSGRSIAVLVHFSQCAVSGTGNSGPEVMGGFLINDYLVPNGQYIAFSDVHETLNPVNARVMEFTRYRVLPDGTASIRTASVQVSDGTLSNQAEYQCVIGKGIHFNIHH